MHFQAADARRDLLAVEGRAAAAEAEADHLRAALTAAQVWKLSPQGPKGSNDLQAAMTRPSPVVC